MRQYLKRNLYLNTCRMFSCLQVSQCLCCLYAARRKYLWINMHTLVYTTNNIYRIEGNFYMVQTFAVFADEPTTARIKNARNFNSPVGTALCRALLQNKNRKDCFWSLWWHFRNSLHPQKFPGYPVSCQLLAVDLFTVVERTLPRLAAKLWSRKMSLLVW